MALLCRFCYASSTPTVRIHQTASATVVATSTPGSLNRPGVVVYHRVVTTYGADLMTDSGDSSQGGSGETGSGTNASTETGQSSNTGTVPTAPDIATPRDDGQQRLEEGGPPPDRLKERG